MAGASLTTKRLDLTALDAEDLDAWVAGDAEALSKRTGATFTAPAKAPPLFDEDLVAIRDMLRREAGHESNAVWLIVERESRLPVGIAGINTGRAPGTAITGYSVYPDQQGKGFATEALRGLIARLFARADVTILQATIPPWNAPSIRVAEKLGMKATGVDRDAEVGEVVVYELQKARRSTLP